MASWVQVIVGLILVLIGGAVANVIPSDPLIGVIIAGVGVFVAASPTFIGKKKE